MFRKMCEHSNGWRPEDGVPDLAMMSDITDEGINVNLRTRYKRNQIYTFSGSILIAVNPYKQLDIYSPQWIARYREQKLDQTDPHVFALAEAMYMNLVMQDYVPAGSSQPDTVNLENTQHSTATATATSSSNNMPSSLSLEQQQLANASVRQNQQMRARNQACVISGESGAGKTETTKFILSYLCSVTPNKSTWMEHQILEANTILEAFGNAKTVRNDNSSRFGKFIQVCFDSRNQINGCIIQDYLLEQSRITYQSVGERNYHVFYQLLAAAQTNQELRRKFHLMPQNFYEYLNKTQCYNIDGVDDCAMFDSLRMAMSVLNMEQESCEGLFSVLSAILWLGNLQFQSCDEFNNTQSANSQTNSDQCYLTENDQEIIRVVAELLGVEREKLEPITLRRQINVRGSITEIPFKIHEAKDNRNGMAKALYSRLFSWVVNFINTSTNPGLDNTSFLAVLDIFGFENFETNSFEQLCINYANEKLHKFFNHHMFAMEQELYQKEGIEFCDINYTDNTPCLELLERPPNCIFRLLSEECRVPKGSDSTFIEKLHTEFSSSTVHPFYIKGTDRRNWSSQFSVNHFAGSVTYNVTGFLKKNKDAQQSQLLDIIETSNNPLLRDLVNLHCPRKPIEASGEKGAAKMNGLRQESVDFIFPPSVASQLNRNNILKSKLHSQMSLNVNSVTSSNKHRHGEFRRESSFGTTTFTNNSSKTKPTVADAFRYQLASLVELLNSVNPWYVRCIKPNLEKSATDYDDRQVLLQLKYLGMSDLIRIRREGYPIHFTKHQFVCRYRCLMLKHLRSNPACSPIRLNEENLDNYCRRMIEYFEMDSNDWKIGKTMVLLRARVYQPMEEKRGQLFVDMATLVQSCWRGYCLRKQYLRMKNAAIRIQDSFRAYRGRLLYLRKKRAVLTIQAYVRGMFAREIANALREIKRAELEKERQQALDAKERNDREKEEDLERDQKIVPTASTEDTNTALEIVVTEPSLIEDLRPENMTTDREKQRQELESSSPISQSNLSSNVSSSTSWVGQEIHSEEAQTKLMNLKDKREMEELVKVLERHGISLDVPGGKGESVYADIEKLYDVLGNQLQINGDSHSISPSINEDDKCSLVTTGTNCDGDSVSYSGQSQVSSTVTDESTNNEDKRTDNSNDYLAEQSSQSIGDETVNQNQDATIPTLENDKYQSNSTESIASIVSSTSIHSNNQTTSVNKEQNQNEAQQSQAQTDILMQQVFDNHSRTSTFTGNSLMVTGSKLVTNGRPLTRIEEEPAASPSKTPIHKRNNSISRPQSLFPPEESGGMDQAKAESYNDIKRRRLERKIIQVQQEQQLQQPINPTTAGIPIQNQEGPKNFSGNFNNEKRSVKNEENIYSIQKCNIIEYAEQTFNNHTRESLGGGGVIRTLTRRRRSVDTTGTEHLTKGEMLSYNSSFVIPTSHIRMHDPHNAQISCSMFKNLCKYMTGESIKSDSEIRIIQSIIRHGIEKNELRDEIYVQIIRQLTNNPNHEYCLRLWILLGLVSAAFSPSKTFSKHLVAYLRSKPRKDPSITCHAQFCLDNLQAPKMYPRRLPPSPLEIQACKNLTNLTCKIHLLDGRIETINIHPCDTALDALTKLAQRIDLQSTEGWALYESYTPGASKYPHPTFEPRGDFERSVRLHCYMTDLIASWQDETQKNTCTNVSLKIAQKRLDEGNFKLTLKKKIFKGAKIKNDPVEISLLYYQAVYNAVRKDNFLVDENLALSLAGLQAQVMLGDASKLGKVDNQSKKMKVNKVLKHQTQVYDVETYICQRLRHQNTSRSKKEWATLISQSHKQFHGSNEVYSKMRYLSMVIYHCPLYGTATFRVTYKGYQTLEQNLLLGVNSEGLVLIRSQDRALINAYRYNDICDDTGITVYADENIIQFNVKDRSDNTTKYMSFESSENEEIAMLMISYHPSLHANIRGVSNTSNFIIDQNFDNNMQKKRSKLKMTLEDRMRTHQEVQNARRAIVRSGKLRKPNCEDISSNLFKHTLKRLSTNKTKSDKSTRFENIYGTTTKPKMNKISSNIPHTCSDYNLDATITNRSLTEVDTNQVPVEVGGATTTTVVDEITRTYPHRYWAYTRIPLKNSLLIIHDSDLEEAALSNFSAILIYSGLINVQNVSDSTSSSYGSTLDSSSIDSGIACQQSLGNMNGKASSGSPSSVSSSDIYDVCPKKLDERELLRLAQGILDRCLKKDADILKNEFFLQLIKQTTDHPEPNSEINQRHWQLLALACSVTFPSDAKILSYLYAHLRRCSLDQVTDEGQYAQFTLRSLQGTLDTRGRRYAPSETEILSTIRCRRVYARVYFLDGEFQAVEFDPCATIAEVVDQIKLRIGLKPECGGYALFQPLDDECEQVLRPEEKVGDAIAYWEAWHRQRQAKLDQQLSVQQQNQTTGVKAGYKSSLAAPNVTSKNRTHRFIFKKYLFLDQMIDLNDAVERELLYYQTVTCIKEDKFPVLEQEATILCALKAQIEIGDYTKLSNLPREHIRMVYKQIIMSLMPPHAFNNLPIPAIAQQHQAFRELSCTDTKKYFFNLIHSIGRANLPNNPGFVLLHRAHIYDATQTFATAWPSDIWIVIDHSGLHMLISKSRRVLASCEYRQIVDYNSNNNYLMVVVLSNSNRIKYTFYTKQAQQIAQQMKDYIVIGSSSGTKRRKSVEFHLKGQTPKQLETRTFTANKIQC